MCSAVGVAPVSAPSLARRHEVDVLQITTYYSLARRCPTSSFDGGAKSAYRRERRGRGWRGGVRDGFLEYGMRQTEEKEERLDSHFKDEQWGLFSLVI